MSQKSDDIRAIAERLSCLSVSSNADSSARITKSDLERFKREIVSAFLSLADILDS